MAIRMRGTSSSGRILAHSVGALALDHWFSKHFAETCWAWHPVSVNWSFEWFCVLQDCVRHCMVARNPGSQQDAVNSYTHSFSFHGCLTELSNF